MNKKVFAVFVAAAFIVGGFFVFNAQALITSILVTSPDGGEKWRGMQIIEWDVTTEEGGDNTVSILLSSNSGGSYSTLVTSIDGTLGEYIWDTTVGPSGPLADGDTYRIKVVNLSTLVDDTSDDDFTVDNTAPATAIDFDIDPDEDTGWFNIDTGKPEITLTCDDNLSGCFSISWSFDGVDFTEVFGDEVVLSDGDIPEGELTLYFFSKDNAVDKDDIHNEEDVQTEDFKVDTVPPAVDSYTLDGLEADAYFNPGLVDIDVVATEPVDWLSAKIEKIDDVDVFKTKLPGNDGFAATSFDWDGSLTSGGPGPVDGEYKILVHIKDVAGNDVDDLELVSYHIFVDTQDPTIDGFDEPEADAVYKDGVGVPLTFTPTDPDPGTPLTCGYKVNDGEFVSIGECTSEDEFSDTVADEDLTDGRNDIFAAVRDSAGNITFSDEPISIIFDDDNTLTVDDDGFGVGLADFNNIPEAILKATAGDTIEVFDGEYDAALTVDKSLTLSGDGGDTSIQTATVMVTANDVTIEGFEFSGDLGSDAFINLDNDVAHSGISIINNTFDGAITTWHVIRAGGNKTDLTITGNTFTDSTSGNDNALIFLGFGGGDINVSDNIFEDFPSTYSLVAIQHNASGGDRTVGIIIDNNSFDYTGYTNDGNGSEAISVRYADYVQATNNTLTGSATATTYEAGITLASVVSDSGQSVISGNSVDGFSRGIRLQRWSAADGFSGDIDILDNVVTDGVTNDDNYGAESTGVGLFIAGVEDLLIQGNTITGNGNAGVYFPDEVSDGADNEFETLVINDNTITGNGIFGIFIDEIYDAEVTINGNTIEDNGEEETGIHINYVGEDSTVAINQNSITGNGTGLFVGESDDVIDATNNWWGTINGPTHPGNTFNVGSQGDEVDDNDGDAEIDFVPWLNAAPPLGVSFAPVTINSEVQYFPSIQAAVDAAEEGDTITAVAGTFTESGIEATTEGIFILGEEGAIVRAPEGCPSSIPSAVFHLHADDITLSGFEIDANGECDNAVHIGDLEEITVAGVKVSGNKIYGATYGVTFSWGSSYDSESPNVAFDNNIHDNNTGVLIDTAHWNTIEDNVIHDNFDNGILIGECVQDIGGCPGGAPSNNTISGNTISNNGEEDTGIDIEGLGAGNSANFNSITGNVIGVANDTDTVFDAEKNWWGSFRGPFHEDDNPVGDGDEATDFVDFSPWCTTEDLEDCEEGGVEFLGSNGPLDSLVLAFDPNPVAIPNASVLTVTAVDEDGVTLVNDSREIELNAGGTTKFDGVSGPALIDLEDGVLTTDVTETVPGTVNVVGKVLGVPFGEEKITFTGDETAPTIDSHTPADNAVGVSVDVVPFLTFSESLKASTVTSANFQLKKYSDDSAVPATVSLVEGGTQVNIDPTDPLEYDTQYYFAVSTSVKDEAGNSLAAALDAGTKADHEFFTEELAGIVLDDIVLPSVGEANDTYLDGWHYIFKITVNNPAETDLFVKFTDWVNTADEDETVPVFDNTRLLLNAGAGVGLTEEDIEEGFSLGNEYEDQTLDGVPTAVDISGVDNNLDKAGRQVQFDVFVKIPEDTAPGFYTTEYGILTE